jgi:hypothetical protein
MEEFVVISPFLRLAGLALLLGLTAFASSAADANSLGANLNIRSPSQGFSQSVYAGGGRPNMGQPSYTPPPYNYGGPGPRVHYFDRNTEFDGATDNSIHGKLPK